MSDLRDAARALADCETVHQTPDAVRVRFPNGKTCWLPNAVAGMVASLRAALDAEQPLVDRRAEILSEIAEVERLIAAVPADSPFGDGGLSYRVEQLRSELGALDAELREFQAWLNTHFHRPEDGN